MSRALVEGQAEQPAGGVERRLDHLLELQVRLDLRLVEIELRLAAPLGVVAPVPGGELEVAAFRLHDRLQRVLLAQRLRRAPAVQTA